MKTQVSGPPRGEFESLKTEKQVSGSPCDVTVVSTVFSRAVVLWCLAEISSGFV